MAAAVPKGWVPDRRDMIWINFNPKFDSETGREMKDEHPMLVLSSKAFNQRTGIVIGLPMTHAASNESNPFAVKVTGIKGQVAYVLAHQPKSFDWRGRGARPHPWKQVTPTVFEAAREELNSILSLGT